LVGRSSWDNQAPRYLPTPADGKGERVRRYTQQAPPQKVEKEGANCKRKQDLKFGASKEEEEARGKRAQKATRRRRNLEAEVLELVRQEASKEEAEEEAEEA